MFGIVMHDVSNGHRGGACTRTVVLFLNDPHMLLKSKAKSDFSEKIKTFISLYTVYSFAFKSIT